MIGPWSDLECEKGVVVGRDLFKQYFSFLVGKNPCLSSKLRGPFLIIQIIDKRDRTGHSYRARRRLIMITLIIPRVHRDSFF